MTLTTAKTRNTLSRRDLLCAVSAMLVLSLAQWPAKASAIELQVDDFLALSKKLTGQNDLSYDLAVKMLKAFSEIGKLDNISALAAEESDDDLGNSIVASWYTGVSPDPDALRVLTYTDTLIWGAMTYTKPMAYCGGTMGYWADPPKA